MEITRLRYFCALAETQSVRRAAELLHVSPGALSKALGQVEALAGAELFARVGRTIVLTDAGRRFQARAARVIAEYGALGADPEADAAPRERPLRIGSFEVFTTHLLGHVIAKTMGEHPVVAHELTPGKMEDAVLAGDVDFALTYAPVVSPALEFIPLCDLTMGVFGSARLVATYAKATFAALPFAVPTTAIGGHVAGFQSLDGWPADAPPRTVRYRFELLETALVLAREGKAVLHCPAFVVKLANRSAADDRQLAPIALPAKTKPVRATAYLVKRIGEPETAHIRAWAKALRRAMG